MLKSYFKSALRNIARHKTHSVISILGLAIGIASFAIIFSYIDYQSSFDHYDKNLDRIYRLATESRFSPDVPYTYFGVIEPRIASIIGSQYSEVSDLVRFTPWSDSYVSVGSRRFVDKGLTFCDPSVFDVFTFQFIQGGEKTALGNPRSVVVTKSASLKYFGTTNSLGKVISIDIGGKRLPFVVGGVMKDVPRNSDLRFDMLMPFKSLNDFFGSEDSVNCYAYLLLRSSSSAKSLSSQLPQIMMKYRPYLSPNSPFRFVLLPLRSLHLHSHLRYDWVQPMNVSNIYILSLVAVVILLVAGTNFTNLSIAQYLTRAKEVGVRKAVGAARSGLVLQFLTESATEAFAATLIGVTLAEIAMPAFVDLTGEGNWSHSFGPGVLLVVFAAGMTVGIISGLYPALYLSSFRASTVSQNKKVSGKAKGNLRKVLVVFQFFVSISLLISMIVIREQLDFMENKDLGFDKNAVVVVRTSSENRYDELRNSLRQKPGILDVGIGMYEPGATQGIARVIDPRNGRIMQMYWNSVDGGFFRTLKMKLAEGRAFSRIFPTTLHGLMLNQSAVKALGWHSAVGRELIAGPDTGRVIGVVRDVYFSSLRHKISPTVYWYDPANFYSALIRISPGRISSGIGEIHSAWKQIAPDSPFEFHFLDQDLDKLYRSEERLGSLIAVFGGLAIAVGCLGLFGLVSFSAEQRTKEIGIRKVLGATVPRVVMMLIRDFAWLVLLANVIAWPLAYYAVNRWLRGFAYHITPSLWAFAAAGLFALIVAMLTVGFQAMRAATTDPVETLRYE